MSTDMIRDLRTIKAAVARLEKKLGGQQAQQADPPVRRKELLHKIYWSGNAIDREKLLPMLHERGTDYRWIGQQVKKGYLSVLPTAPGSARYSVTPKAVRELQLDREIEESQAFGSISEAAFADDWDSDEDSEYDAL